MGTGTGGADYKRSERNFAPHVIDTVFRRGVEQVDMGEIFALAE